MENIEAETEKSILNPIVHLDYDEMGNRVMNRGVYEFGFAALIGHALGNPYGEALRDATKIVGKNPNIPALPKTFKMAAVHLGMRD